MRPCVIAGNWKMNGSCLFIREYCATLSTRLALFSDAQLNNIQLIVFPPSLFLPLAQELLQHSQLAWGAKNASQYDNGAYTGELSVRMLKEFSCRYVLVGHSERRHLLGENNQVIAQKFKQVKQHDLTPILCVGETLAQRECGEILSTIVQQLQAILELDEGIVLLKDSMIAYEPVWAIGTGKTATAAQAQEVHDGIRRFIANYSETIAQELPLLYGGSVNVDNATQLLAMPDIDGVLVGGASLTVDSFLGLIPTGSGITTI